MTFIYKKAFEYQSSLAESDISATMGARRPRRIFLHEVHEVGPGTAQSFLPSPLRLLCRPHGEGKSTEVNYLKYLFGEFKPANNRRKRQSIVEFDEKWKVRGRSDVFELLRVKLGRPKARDFLQLFDRKNEVCELLMLDNIENLSDDAITWLVASAHEAEESQRMDGARVLDNTYIVLSGSFGLGQISRELFSIFYTDELPLRINDYSDANIREIGQRLEGMLSVRLKEDIRESLHALTSGDKRLVNMFLDLCLVIVGEDSKGGKEIRDISPQHLSKASDRYFSLEFRRDRRVQEMLAATAAETRSAEYIKKLINKEFLNWDTVPPRVHKILYNYNIVRIVSGEARFRNTFTRALLSNSMSYRRKAIWFSREFIPRDLSISGSVRTKRVQIVESLLFGAFTGSLVWLYYGEVIATSDDEVEAQVWAWNGDTFVFDLPVSELGRRPSPGTGFIKFKVLAEDGPREEMIFYEESDDNS